MDISDVQYGDLSQLRWLWLVAACGAVVVMAAAARRRAVRRFATANLLPRLLPTPRPLGRLARGGLITAAMAMLVLALVDIRWGKIRREVPQRGIEVMFVLDVSRSMLAEDATPNRLRRAKQQIRDMVGAMAGDRIGLVVFAGEARQHVPLTSHYTEFKQALADVGPYDLYRGGSRLGEAIETAAEGFLDKTAGHKAIVLLSDGEDQGSEPVEVARRVHQQQGIRVFTVGLGDRGQGARIPTGAKSRGEFVRHEGEVVWTRLEEDVLREIAEQTEGAYVPAGTKRVDMAGVYRRYISPIESREFAMAQIDAYQARFQWLLAPAVILLLVEALVAAWPRRPAIAGTGARRAGTAAALLVLLSAGGAAAPPLDPGAAERLNQANRWIEQGELERAAGEYEQLAADHPGHPAILYNQAVVLYHQGQLDEAAKLFQRVAAASNRALAARAHYNLGNTAYRAAVDTAEDKPEAAIERLRSAIERYRRAIRLDRGDDAARTNLELAGRLIDQLQEQLDEQRGADQKPGEPQPDQRQDQPPQGDEQPGDRQQQQQQPAEQGKQGGEQGQPGENQQQQEQQSSAPGPGDAPQPPPETPAGQSDRADEQQSPGSEDQPVSEPQPNGGKPPDEGGSEAEPAPSPSADRPPPGDSQQPGDSQTPSAGRPQDEPQGQQDEGAPDRADGPPQANGPGATEQHEPGGEPPSGPLTAAEDRPGQAGSAGAPPPGAEPRAAMTPEEAQKMLQAIRDRDMLRRLRLQQEKRSRRVPVEKDW